MRFILLYVHIIKALYTCFSALPKEKRELIVLLTSSLSVHIISLVLLATVNHHKYLIIRMIFFNRKTALKLLLVTKKTYYLVFKNDKVNKLQEEFSLTT